MASWPPGSPETQRETQRETSKATGWVSMLAIGAVSPLPASRLHPSLNHPRCTSTRSGPVGGTNGSHRLQGPSACRLSGCPVPADTVKVENAVESGKSTLAKERNHPLTCQGPDLSPTGSSSLTPNLYKSSQRADPGILEHGPQIGQGSSTINGLMAQWQGA